MDKGTNLPSCDVLVIGSGGAGLRAVAAVRKSKIKCCSSYKDDAIS
ncbi:FAD-binding protein [Campylobacter jejuni]|nr:FAD-binding protein [Campylobacter jejuni]